MKTPILRVIISMSCCILVACTQRVHSRLYAQEEFSATSDHNLNKFKEELDRESSSFIGKVVIIGITRFDADGKEIDAEMGHGTIIRINAKEGIVVRISPEQNEFKLPPDLGNLQKAPLGEYKESGTGETIVNPDFMTFWEIHHIRLEEGGGANWKRSPQKEIPKVLVPFLPVEKTRTDHL